jgi:hypothetical protein
MNEEDQKEYDDFTERTKGFKPEQMHALRNFVTIAIDVILHSDKPAVLLRAVEGEDGLSRVLVHCLTPDLDEASAMLQYYMEARAAVIAAAAIDAGAARH